MWGKADVEPDSPAIHLVEWLLQGNSEGRPEGKVLLLALVEIEVVEGIDGAGERVGSNGAHADVFVDFGS